MRKNIAALFAGLMFSANAFALDPPAYSIIRSVTGEAIGLNFIPQNQINASLLRQGEMIVRAATPNTFIIMSHGNWQGTGFTGMSHLTEIMQAEGMTTGFDRCLLASCVQGRALGNNIPSAWAVATELNMPTLALTTPVGNPELLRAKDASKYMTIFQPGDVSLAGNVATAADEAQFLFRSAKTGNLAITKSAQAAIAAQAAQAQAAATADTFFAGQAAKNATDDYFAAKAAASATDEFFASGKYISKAASGAGEAGGLSKYFVGKTSANGVLLVAGASLGMGLEGEVMDSMSSYMPGPAWQFEAKELALEEPSRWRFLNYVNPATAVSGIGYALTGWSWLNWEWTDTYGANLIRQENDLRKKMGRSYYPMQAPLTNEQMQNQIKFFRSAQNCISGRPQVRDLEPRYELKRTFR